MIMLGLFHAAGHSVPASREKAAKKPAMVPEAADLGIAEGFYMQGCMTLKYRDPLAKFTRSCENPYSGNDAKLEQDLMRDIRRRTMRRDIEASVGLFRKAAVMGHDLSQQKMALVFYNFGNRAGNDIVEAQAWCNIGTIGLVPTNKIRDRNRKMLRICSNIEEDMELHELNRSQELAAEMFKQFNSQLDS